QGGSGSLRQAGSRHKALPCGITRPDPVLRASRCIIGCGLLVAAAVLCGCGEERPADIPRPAPGLLSWFEGDCPDLRGDYRFLAIHGGARARYPGVYWEKQMRRVPRHHTVWSIESLDAERMV